MVDRLVNSEVNTCRILNVEACFGSTGQQLAAYGRVLVGEGVLVKMCRQRYNKQHVIPLEEVQLQDLEDEGDMKNGWLIKTRLKSFAVFAATSTEKKEWILHIERCVHDILTRGGKKPATEHAAVWVPDGDATKCMACQRTQFTVIQRRIAVFSVIDCSEKKQYYLSKHLLCNKITPTTSKEGRVHVQSQDFKITVVGKHHCRACGNVVCGTCSSHSYRIPVSKRPVRVCDSDSGHSNSISSGPSMLNDGSSDSDDEDKTVTYDLQPFIIQTCILHISVRKAYALHIVYAGDRALVKKPKEMSSTSAYNRTSSYNRTYEKRIIEQGPKITGIGSSLHPSSVGSPLHVSTSDYQSSPITLTSAARTGLITSHQQSDDYFYVQMDLSQFRPEDLKVTALIMPPITFIRLSVTLCVKNIIPVLLDPVSVANSYIIVEARHNERVDEFGLVERLLIRKFPLSPNVPADAVTSNLTADGHLSVTANAPRQKDDNVARMIPIKMIPSVIKTETRPQNSTTNEQSSMQG
ncbi:Pleckstrin-likey domain-containing family F member 2 [Dirofilaria immitis]|nr:Pleckstrin-likey domain-containing family F member 2 [Dirofilaria immitis]